MRLRDRRRKGPTSELNMRVVTILGWSLTLMIAGVLALLWNGRAVPGEFWGPIGAVLGILGTVLTHEQAASVSTGNVEHMEVDSPVPQEPDAGPPRP